MQHVRQGVIFTNFSLQCFHGKSHSQAMVESKRLLQEENIKGVVSMNENYELKMFSNTKEDWEKLGMANFLQLPTTDIFHAPSVEKLVEGVEFIKSVVDQDTESSVYVHCKAGRTRSATLVGCYLMTTYNLNPEDAVKFMKAKRPHILLHTKQLEALDAYYKK